MSRTEQKVPVSASLDVDVFAALERHCRAHPQASRSQVMNRALRQFLLPDYQEERQRVLAETLDRLCWQEHNHAKLLAQDLRKLHQMVALFVRTFYNHTPEVPLSERESAAAGGERRFRQFLQVLSETTGAELSPLQLMPVQADLIKPDSSEIESQPQRSMETS